MGTDLHLYIEQKQKNGSWKLLLPPKRDLKKYPRTPEGSNNYVSPFWGPGDCFYESKCYGAYDDEKDEEIPCKGKGCQECMGTKRSLKWYRSRNYDVFAILANVRNGSGFAGCDTGDGFNYIAEPRGMPNDVTDYVRNHHSWDHTPSWLMLNEILAFNWDQVTVHRGVIPMRDEDDPHPFGERDSFVAWTMRGGGEPKSYCGGIGGQNLTTVNASTARELLANTSKINKNLRYYVTVSWQMTYRESAKSFLDFVDEYLKPLGDPERLRLVFGFDS